MRVLATHKVNECNRAIVITTEDTPLGVAPKAYIAEHSNPDGSGRGFCQRIEFHAGPVADGVNGITHEVLLAIMIDRLNCFQDGPYACDENAAAMSHLIGARNALASRTLKRQHRGVEGTHTV